MTTRYWDEDTSGEVHLVHSSQAGDRSRSSGYDSDSSDGSNNSMTTIGSDEAGDYFREIHGRRFPVADNLPLALPVDNEELLRFDLRHASIKLLMGGNQWTPIVEALAPVRGRRRRVLDICTRSGTWVKELASERPDVDFVSVDIAPVAPHTPSANIEFEVYNVLEGIHAQDASFDLVYCSSTMTTFRDYRAFLPEIRRVLRPGGLFLFCETELEVYDASDPQLVRPANNAPGLTRFARLARRELERQGVSARAPTQMSAWLDANSGFHPPTHEMRAIPNGAWHPHALMHDVGLMAARVWKATTFSLRPMLLSFGTSPQDCEALTQAVLRDLQNPDIQTITKFHMVWARRN
ncbi:Methyltransferase domain, partial [Rhizoctonia solani]